MVIEAHVMDQRRRTVCVREIQKSLSQSVKRLLELKIEQLGVEDYFEIQQFEIKSRHGDGIIIFQGMQNHTSDSIKSLEGYDCAWVEESQSYRNALSTYCVRQSVSLNQSFGSHGTRLTAATRLICCCVGQVLHLMHRCRLTTGTILGSLMCLKQKWNMIGIETLTNISTFGWGYSSNSEARVFRNWKHRGL
jgi:hypothetical protein